MKSENRYGFDYGDNDIPEIDLPKTDYIQTDFPDEYHNRTEDKKEQKKDTK